MPFKITDNSNEVLEALSQQLEVALGAVGIEASGNAKQYETAVDTGRLRASISYATKTSSGGGSSTPKGSPNENSVCIGTNVEYAPYIEYGTSKMNGVHYLQQAVENHLGTYKEIIEKGLKN